MTKAIDFLSKELYSDNYSHDKLKALISQIGQLRYDITRDHELPLTSNHKWNYEIQKISTNNRTWFKANWLFIECLMYRLLWEMVIEIGVDLDIFKGQKSKATLDAKNDMRDMAAVVLGSKVGLEQYIHWALWGNRHDLSLNPNGVSTLSESVVDNIIINDIIHLTSHLKTARNVIIVLDNSGMELFTDLLLARYLVIELSIKVKFYGKQFPWFVSDVTRKDFDLALDKSQYDDANLVTLVNEFNLFITNGDWIFDEHEFFTMPYSYWDIGIVSADLKTEFEETDFILFKGDLNYRKVFDF